jgi:hypothetical protein
MKKNIIVFSAIFLLSVATSCSDYMNDMDIQTGLNEGLVVYLPAFENSGTILKNFGSLGGNAVISNGSITTQGKYGNSLLMPDDTATVYLSTSENLLNKNEITITMWVNPFTLGRLGNSFIYTSNSFRLYWTGSDPFYLNFSIYISAFYDYTSSYEVRFDSWQFIAATYDGSRVKMFVNGKMIFSQASSGTMGTSNSFQIGNFTGMADEIRIYNRALSQDEIKALMDIGME